MLNHPLQYGAPVNSSTVSGSNSALTVTITPQAGQAIHLNSVEAFTSAGTCSFTIESPSGTVVYRGATGGVSTTPWYLEPVRPIRFAKGVAVLLKTSAAGSSNTSTINAGLEIHS